MINRFEYILPSHYAGYLINDDATNLTDEEFTRINAWASGKGYCIGTIGDEPFFRHGHELNANEGADCFRFVFAKDTIDAITFEIPKKYIDKKVNLANQWFYRTYFINDELLSFARKRALVFNKETLWGLELYKYSASLDTPDGAMSILVKEGFNIVDVSKMTKDEVCKNPELFRLVLNGVITEEMLKHERVNLK